MSTDTSPITDFRGRYFFLSNFCPCRVTLDGVAYSCVEQAFQAAKTPDPTQRSLIRVARANEARKLGRKVTLRPDWFRVRLHIMEALLRQKFSQPDFRAQLQSTHPRELIEGNTWGDIFWGVYEGRGENNLGILLMKLREEIMNDGKET